MFDQEEERRIYARRDAEVAATKAILLGGGRELFRRYISGNVRTRVFANRHDTNVQVLVDQIRLYSTLRGHGTSRGLEAGDMKHAIDGLSSAEREIAGWRLPQHRFPRLSEQQVRNAVDRGDNQPDKVVIFGNQTALLWANAAGSSDFVFKTELLYAISPDAAIRPIPVEGIGDARKCLAACAAHINERYRTLAGLL
jgi:hypothetical protein